MKTKAGKREIGPSLVVVIIALVFALLAVSYSLVTDLKGGPDETAHLIYIRSLAIDHVLPPIAHSSINSLESQSTHEGHQPPLYYAVMAVPYALLHSMGAPTDLIWRVIRILGVAFGACWIISIFYLARVVLGSDRWGLAVAAFVALIPTAAYMAGVVNNDIMVSMWFGWAMYLIVKYVKDGVMATKTALYLGAIIGLAILTKAQGMILVPLFGIAALAVWLGKRPRDTRSVGGVVGTVLVTAAVIGGWWLMRSLIAHGSLQSESLTNPLLPNGLSDIHGQWLQFLSLVRTVCINTWGYFWTPFWLLRPFVNSLCYSNAVIAVSALPLLLMLVRILLVRDLDMRLIGLLLIAAGTIVVTWLWHVFIVDAGANLQGRLFLPVAPAIGVFIVGGMQPWLGKRLPQLFAACIVYGSMLLANILILRLVVSYYALGYGQ